MIARENHARHSVEAEVASLKAKDVIVVDPLVDPIYERLVEAGKEKTITFLRYWPGGEPSMQEVDGRRLLSQVSSLSCDEDVPIDYPWTYYPKDRDDVASAECSYPVIIKPAEKSKSNAFTYAKAWKVWSRDELLAR